MRTSNHFVSEKNTRDLSANHSSSPIAFEELKRELNTLVDCPSLLKPLPNTSEAKIQLQKDLSLSSKLNNIELCLFAPTEKKYSYAEEATKATFGDTSSLKTKGHIRLTSAEILPSDKNREIPKAHKWNSQTKLINQTSIRVEEGQNGKNLLEFDDYSLQEIEETETVQSPINIEINNNTIELNTKNIEINNKNIEINNKNIEIIDHKQENNSPLGQTISGEVFHTKERPNITIMDQVMNMSLQESINENSFLNQNDPQDSQNNPEPPLQYNKNCLVLHHIPYLRKSCLNLDANIDPLPYQQRFISFPLSKSQSKLNYVESFDDTVLESLESLEHIDGAEPLVIQYYTEQDQPREPKYEVDMFQEQEDYLRRKREMNQALQDLSENGNHKNNGQNAPQNARFIHPQLEEDFGLEDSDSDDS